MSARAVDVIHAVLLALYWAACIVLWAALPERVPHHFGLGGQPTSWTRTSPLSWFGLPAMAVAMWLFVRGMMRLSETNPTLWNIPEKQRFLELTPARRAPALAALRAAMAWVALLVTLTFAAIQVAIYETATGRSDGLAWYVQLAVWGAILGTIAVPLAYMPRVRRLIREA